MTSNKYITSKMQKELAKPAGRIVMQDVPNVKILDGDGKKDLVYLGRAEDFFGHFLQDSLPKAWIATDIREFVYSGDPRFAEFYKIAGIDARPIKKNEKFRKMYIPESAMDAKHYRVSRKFADLCATMQNNVPDAGWGEKIYMSRLDISNDEVSTNAVFGEEKIAEIFRRAGYRIVTPEKYSLREQIAIVKNCTHLAGTSGSALMHSMFMKPGGKVCCLCRANAIIEAQVLIDAAIGTRTEFVAASINPYDTGRNSSSRPHLIGDTPQLRAWLDDNEILYFEEDFTVDVATMAAFESAWKKSAPRLPIKLVKIIGLLIPKKSWRKRFRKFMRTSDR